VTDTTGDVELLRRAVQKEPERVADPALVLVAGLPGAGKSHFSRKLGERLDCAIVESDAMRRALWRAPTYGPRENQRLFRAAYRLIEDLLREGIGVVFDATNLQERHRERLYRVADRLGVKLILVWVEAPANVIRERLRGRSLSVDPTDISEADWDIHLRMKANAERFSRDYFAVDTSRDIAPVIERIRRKART
jgi:predicted kinase